MKTRVKTAALTFAALSAAVVLMHGVGVTPRQDGDVTPRTVVQAEPAEPLCPFPLARCAPIPPEPLTRLKVEVPEVPKTAEANEYSAAWNEIEVGR